MPIPLLPVVNIAELESRAPLKMVMSDLGVTGITATRYLDLLVEEPFLQK
jgi:hypothetical protein